MNINEAIRLINEQSFNKNSLKNIFDRKIYDNSIYKCATCACDGTNCSCNTDCACDWVCQCEYH